MRPFHQTGWASGGLVRPEAAWPEGMRSDGQTSDPPLVLRSREGNEDEEAGVVDRAGGQRAVSKRAAGTGAHGAERAVGNAEGLWGAQRGGPQRRALEARPFHNWTCLGVIQTASFIRLKCGSLPLAE